MLLNQIIRRFALYDTEGEGGGGTAVETVEQTVERVGKSLDFSKATEKPALQVTEEATDGPAGEVDGQDQGDPPVDDGRGEPSASADDGESGQRDAPAEEGEQPQPDHVEAETTGAAAEPEAEEEPGPFEPEAEAEPEPAATPAETFSFHGRRPEDPSIEIDLSGLDQEQADAIKRTYNMGIRAQEAAEREASVQADVAAVEDFVGALNTDPVGTLMNRVTDPDIRANLARNLLADPAIYNAVIEDIAKWDADPNVREAAAARLDLERRDNSAAAQRTMAAKAAARNNINQLEARLGLMAGDALNPEHAKLFVKLGMDEVMKYVRQFPGTESIHPDSLPALLRQTGLPGVFAGIDLDAVPATPQDLPSAARASVPAKPEPGRAGAEAGAAFAARAQAKKVAAGVSPVGTPAPTALRPPPGMGVEERIEWLAKQNISFTP